MSETLVLRTKYAALSKARLGMAIPFSKFLLASMPKLLLRTRSSAHSIWELVLHIAAWDDVAIRRIGGAAVELRDEQNFPPIKDTGEAAWTQSIELLRGHTRRPGEAVASFPDSRLNEQVPCKQEKYYNFFYLFSGIVQHELYHAGQIALLKKAAE